MILSEFETFMFDSGRKQPKELIFIYLRPTLPKYAEQNTFYYNVYIFTGENIKTINVLIHFTDGEQIHNFHMLIYFQNVYFQGF